MPYIEVSVGELLDKYSILEIKHEMLSDDAQKKNVNLEIMSHKSVIAEYFSQNEIQKAYLELKAVNKDIWNGMDKVFEIGDTPTKDYDPLTREITRLNMQRAYLKKEIDKLSKSNLTEEKSYFKGN
jgi:hypothetical protein